MAIQKPKRLNTRRCYVLRRKLQGTRHKNMGNE